MGPTNQCDRQSLKALSHLSPPDWPAEQGIRMLRDKIPYFHSACNDEIVTNYFRSLKRRIPAGYFVRAALGILFLASSIDSTRAGGPTVVGYYPDWNRGAYPKSVIAYQNLTHIAHAFLIPNGDGTLGGTNGFAYPEMVLAAHQAGVKVIVVLGGWGGSDGFSPMAADTASRHRFVQNVKTFCRTNGYDGVDLDWEYPASAADRTNLALLVHELRQAFTGATPALSISLAMPAGDWTGRWFDVALMKDDADWFGIMTYDFFGSWTSTSGPNSPLYGKWSTNNQGWIDDSYQYYAGTRALPSNKIVLGIPFYGWIFNSSTMYGASTGASQKSYTSILPNLTQGWTRLWDSVGQVPYMINPGATQVISYDDTMSIGIKCRYAVGKGVQGTMIWALGQDYLNSEQPLLDVVGKALGRVSGIVPTATPSLPASFVLDQNYPNPFNPSTTIQFSIKNSEFSILKVYDILGREVTVLVDEKKEPGTYTVHFDASGLAGGVYFYRLAAGEFHEVKKMVLLR